MNKRYETWGIRVRVKREVEELVREVADTLGYYPYTVRNLAILLGIQQIAANPNIPKTDKAFESLLDKTRLVVRELMDYGEEEGEMG